MKTTHRYACILRACLDDADLQPQIIFLLGITEHEIIAKSILSAMLTGSLACRAALGKNTLSAKATDDIAVKSKVTERIKPRIFILFLLFLKSGI